MHGRRRRARARHGRCSQSIVVASCSPHGARAGRFASFLLTLGTARATLGLFLAAEATLLEACPVFVVCPGAPPEGARDGARALVDVYAAWLAADPGRRHDARAAEWQGRLVAM